MALAEAGMDSPVWEKGRITGATVEIMMLVCYQMHIDRSAVVGAIGNVSIVVVVRRGVHHGTTSMQRVLQAGRAIHQGRGTHCHEIQGIAEAGSMSPR